ncbi:hypothetical protein [Conexibacter woesei]|uniref:Uncharacterized protein n=1 Tax=Conexibacter woesei (strain DSM 14684 / CCUG 47730 / CIP 108061 / JCM 11494 / NBRC 100937 / ID131577) TaxID=469383 RepID=D3F9Y2_CONWI|nr:hypothetical protein [Conexibacter woesei]ADB53077.1 hypothetical protein Cwoe_4664 [Conexibacter woesei DSM 14684]
MAPDIRDIDRSPDDEAGIHARERLLDDELRRLRRESDRVGHDIDEARKDWERKRADRGVPGARPHEDSPGDPLNEVAGNWRGTAQAAEEGGQG